MSKNKPAEVNINWWALILGVIGFIVGTILIILKFI